MGKALIGFIVGLLFVPVIAAVIVFTGRFPIRATARPPRWERRIANLALDPAVERLARGRTSPIAGNDEDLMAGMELYRAACRGCHGDPGKPSAFGRNFYPPAPQLAERGDRDP
ncbi:MAG TPA: cytochrome c, partial [Terriglobales bacterium]|nr:cytochrome c [Terriglobales bacterium]